MLSSRLIAASRAASPSTQADEIEDAVFGTVIDSLDEVSASVLSVFSNQ